MSHVEKKKKERSKKKKKKAGLLPIIRPVWWFGECRALAWDNAQELLRLVHQDVVWRQKATHAYSGSDSRYWPRHYLRQETRTRVMPLLPVVSSCRSRGDRQSPSTRDGRSCSEPMWCWIWPDLSDCLKSSRASDRRFNSLERHYK